MIDPSFATAGDNGAAVITPYPPTIHELERKIAELENNLAGMTQNYEYWLGKYKENQAKIDNLEEYVTENFDYIDENVAQELIDIFGFEITKDYDVTVTVTFSGTVTAPLNFDMDDLENSLDARLDFSYYADGTADFMEDKMEIDWSES